MTKTGKQGAGRGEPFAEPNPPPASDPRRRWQGQVAGSGGPPQRQKVLGLEGAQGHDPRLRQERGGRDGFWGAEKERERMTLSQRWGAGCGAGLPAGEGEGIDLDLPPSLPFRNPSFLPVTFMAKEEMGLWEREAEAPPSVLGRGILGPSQVLL